MNITLAPMFGAMIGGWEIILILLSMFVGLAFLVGIIVLAIFLARRVSKLPPASPAPAPASVPDPPVKPSVVTPTVAISSNCAQCGTPLPGGALAGLCPACLLKAGAAPDTVMPDKPGAFTPPSVSELAPLFPQLEIIELIGKGGMGAVYKARQKQLDRFVALKILPPGIGGDPTFAERFAREAKALAKLNHPGIVTLYEFGSTSGHQPSTLNFQLFYFLMEFVDGLNLRQLLHAGRVSAREALAIVPQICDALQFAHDQGIVHRDIKPENILLDRRGRVKVADFGLAKIVCNDGGADLPVSQAAQQHRPADALTDAGKVMGTPQYMSPEQIHAPGEVDHRADIYALGVVFYQMLTGELPGKKLEPPSRKVSIDVRLDEVVLRALEKKPELRYQQVSEMKTGVETIAGKPDPGSRGRQSAPSESERTDEDLRRLTSAATSGESRFSRTAIAGVCLVIFGAVLFALAAIVSTAATVSILPDGQSLPNKPASFVAMVLVLAGASCVLVSTVLGWVAVSQIRRAVGKLYGMWLAVFDGLLLPLLVLSALVIWAGDVISRLFPPRLLPFLGPVLVGLIALALFRLTYWIILRVWRAVNQPGRSPNSRDEAAPIESGRGHSLVTSAATVQRYGQLAFGLFLAGTLGTLLLLTVSYRHDMALIFGCAALLLSFTFGLMSWRERLGKFVVVALGSVFAVVGLGLLLYLGAFGPARRAAMERVAGELRAAKLAQLERVKSEKSASTTGASTNAGFFIGQAYFPRGDSIEITSVERSQDRMTVKGRYNLVSADRAQLALYITTTKNSSAQEDSGQTMEIAKGRGEFELTHSHLVPGLPHLTMYAEGRPFAEVYFGTKAEALAESKLDLQPARSFGPVIERTLPMNELGYSYSFNLDTDAMLPMPANMTQADWSSGVTLPDGLIVVAAGEGKPVLVAGTSTQVEPVRNGAAAWESMRANDIRIPYELEPGQTVTVSGETNTVPLTFTFQTKTGTSGLLQVTGFTDNPRGAKIRYKLVHGVAGSPPTNMNKSLVSSNGHSAIQFRLVAREDETNAPADLLSNPYDHTGDSKLRVLKEVVLDGSAIAKAGLQPGRDGQTEISFVWSDSGRLRFAELTAANVGRQLAMVYEDEVLTAPRINAAIDGGIGKITGKLPDAEAERIVRGLNQPTTGGADLRFGDTVEYVLPQQPPTSRQSVFLALTSRQWLTNAFSTGEAREFYQWIRQHGADVSGGSDLREAHDRLQTNNPTAAANEPAPIPLAFWYDTVVVHAGTNAWETVTPTAVKYRWELMIQEAEKQAIVGKREGLADAYYFRTRDKRSGLLQVTGFSDNPRGVKIRYKLVQ